MTLVPEDLRLRLVATLLLVIAISQIGDLAAGVAALVGAALLVLAARPGPGTLRRLLHVELFVILLFVTLPFSVPGEPLAHVGPLAASVEGLQRAALLGAKVSASVLVLMVFLGAIDPVRIGGALTALRVPEPIVRLFVLTARYLSLIRAEARRLQDAMRARGFRPGSNRHTWASYGNLMGMLLVRALDRARRVEEAMRLRGPQGHLPQVALSRPTQGDWARMGAAVVLAAAILIWGRI